MAVPSGKNYTLVRDTLMHVYDMAEGDLKDMAMMTGDDAKVSIFYLSFVSFLLVFIEKDK